MIKLRPKFRRNLLQVIPFGIIWLINGWAFLWSEYAVLGDQSDAVEVAIKITPYIAVFASISIFITGCLVGVLEVAFMYRFFVNGSFPQKIIGKFLLYGVLFFALIFIFYVLATSIETKTSLFSASVLDQFTNFFFSFTYITIGLQLGFSLIVSLIYAEISDNLGQNVFLNFFTGKYHKPVVEQRIFMFTDMKSSTEFAEQLGHITYFDFLKDYYNDLSDAIIENYGEVYQYIGDEIVISWDLNKKNAVRNSINCFYAMEKDLLKKKDWYLKKYDVYPDFKGALHLGEVTTGEIGALKKEIFFTGDVLNTTARIQGLCNQYPTDLLISQDFLDKLEYKDDFEINHIGRVPLKGKNESKELYTVLKKT